MKQFFKNPSIRTIFWIWLAWAVILIGFQELVAARVTPHRPDFALNWTAEETRLYSQSKKVYLNEPFLNKHVAWDSEFYLSIAVGGYDDPLVRQAVSWTTGEVGPSLNYAFFPLYPLLIRGVAAPFRLLGMGAIAAASLAGVLVSLLGALVAMIGLYYMSRADLGEEGGIRAAFYLLIFPSGFFLAQVYTEGVFLGLVFCCLACLKERRWIPTAILAALAVWTRPGGGALLVLPLAWVWYREHSWEDGWKTLLLRSLCVAAPVISYFVWTLTPLATHFWWVEDNYFSRGLMALGPSISGWLSGIVSLFGSNSQMAAYYLIELFAVALAIYTCVKMWDEHTEVAVFGIATTLFAMTSGSAQGMVRYVLAVPCIFWMLARKGKNPVFDRAWTLLSILLMGLLVFLFSFDFWVA